MGDTAQWRKNLPVDFDGRQGDSWDDEIDVKPILWTSVALAGAVAFAFAVCFGLMGVLQSFQPEPRVSPIAEANERRLPPQPWVQPKPEMEMEAFREQLIERLSSYGWSDQLEGTVHIPVEEAMGIVLASAGSVAPTVEPAVDEPLIVDQPPLAAPVRRDAEEAGGEGTP